jgi:phospholipase/carboxylesterase
VPTKNETFTLDEAGWTVRVKQPEETTSPRSMLLIHGLMGDENVMWIFSSKIPKNYWLFSPRGILKEASGFSWLLHEGEWPSLDDFAQPAKALIDGFSSWANETGAPQDIIDVMGFSQGAAMAYALAALYPQKINRVMALAGFLPKEESLPGRYSAYSEKQVYVAHGTQDDIVPVHMAEEAVQALQAAGAQVTFCESDSGHKLSASCLRGLGEFLV